MVRDLLVLALAVSLLAPSVHRGASQEIPGVDDYGGLDYSLPDSSEFKEEQDAPSTTSEAYPVLLSSNVEDLEGKVKNLTEQLETLKSENDGLKTELEQLQNQFDDVGNKIAEFHGGEFKPEKFSEILGQTLSSFKKNEDDAKELIQTYIKEIKDLNERIEVQNSDISDVRNELFIQEGVNNNTERYLMDCEDVYNETVKELEITKSNLNECNNNLKDALQNIIDNNDEITVKLNNCMDEKKSSEIQLLEQLNVTQLQLVVCKDSLLDLKAENEEINDKIEYYSLNLNTCNSKLESNQKEFTDQINILQSELSHCNETLLHTGEQIIDFDAKVQECTAHLENCKKEQESNQAASMLHINNTNLDLIQCKNNLSNLDLNYKSRFSTIQELSEQLKSCNTAQETCTIQLNQLKKQITLKLNELKENVRTTGNNIQICEIEKNSVIHNNNELIKLMNLNKNNFATEIDELKLINTECISENEACNKKLTSCSNNKDIDNTNVQNIEIKLQNSESKLKYCTNKKIECIKRKNDITKHFNELQIEKAQIVTSVDKEVVKLHDIANSFLNIKEYNKSLALLRIAYNTELSLHNGSQHEHPLKIMSNIGGVLYIMGRYQEALPYEKKALEGKIKKLGENNTSTIVSLRNLALTYKKLGNNSEALILLKKLINKPKEVLLKSLDHDSIDHVLKVIKKLEQNN